MKIFLTHCFVVASLHAAVGTHNRLPAVPMGPDKQSGNQSEMWCIPPLLPPHSIDWFDFPAAYARTPWQFPYCCSFGIGTWKRSTDHTILIHCVHPSELHRQGAVLFFCLSGKKVNFIVPPDLSLNVKFYKIKELKSKDFLTPPFVHPCKKNLYLSTIKIIILYYSVDFYMI